MANTRSPRSARAQQRSFSLNSALCDPHCAELLVACMQGGSGGDSDACVDPTSSHPQKRDSMYTCPPPPLSLSLSLYCSFSLVKFTPCAYSLAGGQRCSDAKKKKKSAGEACLDEPRTRRHLLQIQRGHSLHEDVAGLYHRSKYGSFSRTRHQGGRPTCASETNKTSALLMATSGNDKWKGRRLLAQHWTAVTEARRRGFHPSRTNN